MTLLELFNKAAKGALDLEARLSDLQQKYPDAAVELGELKAKLLAGVDPVNLAAVGAAIPGELLNIAQGKIEPRDHAGDAI
jgi:hypothetical protein